MIFLRMPQLLSILETIKHSGERLKHRKSLTTRDMLRSRPITGTSAEPPAEGRAGKPAPPFPASQLGTYLHAQHYHFVAPNLPFATAAAEGLIDPTRYGPLPWVGMLLSA